MQIILAAEVTVKPNAEGVLLVDPSGEECYELDPVGARLWELLGADGDLDHAVAQLLLEYEVEEVELRTDLLELLNDLADMGLVAVEADLD